MFFFFAFVFCMYWPFTLNILPFLSSWQTPTHLKTQFRRLQFLDAFCDLSNQAYIFFLLLHFVMLETWSHHLSYLTLSYEASQPQEQHCVQVHIFLHLLQCMIYQTFFKWMNGFDIPSYWSYYPWLHGVFLFIFKMHSENTCGSAVVNVGKMNC